MNLSNKKSESGSYRYYTGIIKRVSNARNFKFPDRRGNIDFFKIGIKTEDDKRILIILNPKEMGWSGQVHKSKIYYYKKESNRLIKTTLSNPEKYIGKKVKVLGELHSINEKERKYKLSPLKEFILYLD